MNASITLGAAVLMAALIVATFTARWYVTRPGTGRRRAQQPQRTEALEKFEAECVFEERPTLHVRFRLGGVMCLECRNATGGGL